MNAKRAFAVTVLLALLLAACCLLPGAASAQDGAIVLRICNWEEYIDLGDWDEAIELENGEVYGENPMIEDFEEWYYETYGEEVRVEYSTFGTNEDLYNMLTIGDVYDLVCPSEYMIMKLITEDKLVPLSKSFYDENGENNYYIRGVSPYIRKIFKTPHGDDNIVWDQYAAGYMWGVTGFVYNSDVVSEEEASTWNLLGNSKYYRQVTIKDNVRDAYFAAVGAIKSEQLTDEAFTNNNPNYAAELQEMMNDVSQETIDEAQEYLQRIKDNLYSFETDSGKADMITGKVVANYQWSGDAITIMDEVDELNEENEEQYNLCFAIPKECTNIYFDGWVMLKSGIEQDARKQKAAEAFINFISRPDNVIRNMYYIGYTSVIAAADDGRIFEYLTQKYGEEDDEGEPEAAAGEAETEETGEPEEETGEPAEESGEAAAENPDGKPEEDTEEDTEEETVEYDVSYFFQGEGSTGAYVLTVPKDQLNRQLSAQYPSEDVIKRASIMINFNEDGNRAINKMWIRVRCFNINQVPTWVWIALAALIVGGIAFWLLRKAARNRQYN